MDEIQVHPGKSMILLRHRVLARSLFASAVLFCSASHLAAEPATFSALRNNSLDPGGAVAIRNVDLDMGPARMMLTSGTLYPAAPVNGNVHEMVFIGEGEITLDAPDAIEAAQLTLFTGKPALREQFSEIVLVFGDGKASAQLLGRGGAAPPGDRPDQRARELFAEWKVSAERNLIGAESAIWISASEDPSFAGYFAARINTPAFGEFLYLVDPTSFEQVTLGQFIPLDATERQKKKIARVVLREQRRGRMLGITPEQLGQWDVWMSTSNRHESGELDRGRSAFEPSHYSIDIQLADHTLELEGRAEVELQSVTDASRFAVFELFSDLQVRSVRLRSGDALEFMQSGARIVVDLGRVVKAGEKTHVELAYDGAILEKLSRGSYLLRDTESWYPHTGQIDRATYDVTFQWPRSLDLYASGRQTGSGEREGQKWQQRRLEFPSVGFSFEVGHYDEETLQAGDIAATVAWDKHAAQLDKRSRKEILDTIADSLVFFEQRYGEYPLDHLTVVTVPRAMSQGMLGFVSLSTLAMFDFGAMGTLFGVEDRRTVIAHELAHQWFGNLVGWTSYRDQWLSEALANYAAMSYGRKALAGKARAGSGPTAGWQYSLLSTTEAGRTIESLGPVILGARLVSSQSEEAYQAVTYLKGAIVMDMLSRSIGDQNFDKVLNRLVKQAANKPISTEDFVTFVSRATNYELKSFAKQFIYGTGVPEVFYDYEISKTADGQWRVTGTAEQFAPLSFRHWLAESDGRFVAQRERTADVIPDWLVMVPLQVAVFAPDRGAVPKRPRGDQLAGTNAFANSEVRLQGTRTMFTLDSPWEPKRVWLDRNDEVLARFYSSSHDAKQVLVSKGEHYAADGNLQNASQSFRAALEASMDSSLAMHEFSQFDRKTRHTILNEVGLLLDARAHLGLAAIALELGHREEFDAELKLARKIGGGSRRQWIEEDMLVMESRALVQDAEYEEAFQRLRKRVLGREGMTSVEGVLLFAIAAHATGRTTDLETALELAKKKGADVSALATRAGVRPAA